MKYVEYGENVRLHYLFMYMCFYLINSTLSWTCFISDTELDLGDTKMRMIDSTLMMF